MAEHDNHGQQHDPTANVAAQFRAEAKRQDDLREASEKLMTSKITDLSILLDSKMLSLKSQMEHYEVNAEALRIAEAKRIDSIRAVDVGNVAIATKEANDRASILASQLTASNDANRALVATTAQTQQVTYAASNAEILKRVGALELTSSVGSGKGAGVQNTWQTFVTVIALLIAAGSMYYGSQRVVLPTAVPPRHVI